MPETEQRDPYQIPKWAMDYVTHVIVHILKPEMPVSFRLSSFEDSPNSAAEADINWTYLRANIRVMDTIKPNEDGYNHLTHELLHVAQWAQLQTVAQLEAMLDKRGRKLLHDLFEAANEQTIQRLTRALTPLFRADFERAQEAKKQDQNGGQDA